MRGRRPVIRLSMVGLRIELPDTKDRPCEDARCVKARGEPYAWLADTPLSCSPPRPQIGRAHVCTPVTNAQLVCRLLLEINNTIPDTATPTNTVLQHKYLTHITQS